MTDDYVFLTQDQIKLTQYITAPAGYFLVHYDPQGCCILYEEPILAWAIVPEIRRNGQREEQSNIWPMADSGI